jgi:cytochrome c oxidase subunit IV
MGQAAAIGLIWMVMTAGFEFGFFHYAMGYSWERLLRDYDVIAGRVWVLVLIWIAAWPPLLYRWRYSNS